MQAGKKNIDFDPNTPNDNYLMQGFVEFEIGITPDQTHFIANNTQAKRKQYGLNHVMSTIHSAMGDTLQITETEISQSNVNYNFLINDK